MTHPERTTRILLATTRRGLMPAMFTAVVVTVLAGACRPGDEHSRSAPADSATAQAAAAGSACDNAGLTLPDGFCATVFADSIGHARHLAVGPDGTVYANTWSGRYYGNDQPHTGGFLVALRDTTGDGRADIVARFGDSVQSGGHGGTGIAVYRGAVYAESNDRILRYALSGGNPVPSGKPTTVVEALPLTGDHPMHPFAIDSSGGLYIDLGSATNACQIENRIPLSKGHQPCTELKTRGGIWRYDANQKGQRFSPAARFAAGIRNADGIAVDSTGHGIYATQHGRDQLAENWPKLYQPVQGANFPSEELLRVEKGADYGWPECYFDSTRVKLVLAPEYGGDGGKAVGQCGSKRSPVAYFRRTGHRTICCFTTGNSSPRGIVEVRSSPFTDPGTGHPFRRAGTTSSSCRSPATSRPASTRCSPMVSRERSRRLVRPRTARRVSRPARTARSTLPMTNAGASGGWPTAVGAERRQHNGVSRSRPGPFRLRAPAGRHVRPPSRWAHRRAFTPTRGLRRGTPLARRPVRPR